MLGFQKAGDFLTNDELKINSAFLEVTRMYRMLEVYGLELIFS